MLNGKVTLPETTTAELAPKGKDHQTWELHLWFLEAFVVGFRKGNSCCFVCSYFYL